LELTKQTVENLRDKLKNVEHLTASSEDRVCQVEKAISEEKYQHHQLSESSARLLTKKHHETTQMEQTQRSVKNLQTENSVSCIQMFACYK